MILPHFTNYTVESLQTRDQEAKKKDKHRVKLIEQRVPLVSLSESLHHL